MNETTKEISPNLGYKIPESDKSLKQDLSRMTLEVATHIITTAPQFYTDTSGEKKVNYCFAGSFAGNLFSQITSFREAHLTLQKKGDQRDWEAKLNISEQNQILTDETRTVLMDLVRPVKDIDVAGVEKGEPYRVASYLHHEDGLLVKGKIRKLIPKPYELFKQWYPDIDGDPFDRIFIQSDQQIIAAKIGENNTEILLAHPAEMIAYKLYELSLPDFQDENEYTEKLKNDVAFLHKAVLKMFGNTDSLLPSLVRIASKTSYGPESGILELMREKLNSIVTPTTETKQS